jgi:fluoride exporter
MKPDETRAEIRSEIAGMPVDPEVSVLPRPYPHPLTLIRANADLLPVIAAGGILGSLARWGLAEAFPHPASGLAWGTFLANVTGALLIGLLMAFVLDVWSSRRYVRPFLGVGILGGYTTFSTWMLDTRGLLASGRPALALAYVVATLVGGLVAVAAGLAAGRWAIDHTRTTATEAAE